VQRYDEERTVALELQGLRVVRFTNLEAVQNFESVCEEIVAALKT
jgi:very-short-patch-repair endonuclease